MKKIFIPIIALFCILLAAIVIIHYHTRSSEVSSLLQPDPPTELYLYFTMQGSDTKEAVFTERTVIEALHYTVKDKIARRQFTKWPDKDQIVLTMDYGYKGNTVCIDNDGRIFISEDAAELRDKSRLHWLWWKIVSRSSSHITYFTYPDPKVLGVAKRITGSSSSLNFSFDKNGNYTGFSDLPLSYTIENAKNNGYFVTQDLKVIANKSVWDKFVESSLHRENTSIRIAIFYTEMSDRPYFLDLFYQDGYYYLFDSSSEKQEKQPYLCLLTLEGRFGNPLRDSSVIVLTNDDTLTFDKVMRVMASSSMDFIKSVSPFEIVMFK